MVFKQQLQVLDGEKGLFLFHFDLDGEQILNLSEFIGLLFKLKLGLLLEPIYIFLIIEYFLMGADFLVRGGISEGLGLIIEYLWLEALVDFDTGVSRGDDVVV